MGLAGERRHRSKNGGHPRAQGIKTVTPVVDMVSGVDGVADGELRGGWWSSGKVILGPRWFPIEIEQGEGFRGGR